jgi:hypothetical protein
MIDQSNIIQRSEQWLESKKRKLEVQREIGKDHDLEGCTFAPELVRPLPNPKLKSDISYQRIEKEHKKFKNKGIEQHLRRQKEARKSRKEKKEILARGYRSKNTSKPLYLTSREVEEQSYGSKENEARNDD